MKRIGVLILCALIGVVLLTGCGPKKELTGSWISPELVEEFGISRLEEMVGSKKSLDPPVMEFTKDNHIIIKLGKKPLIDILAEVLQSNNFPAESIENFKRSFPVMSYKIVEDGKMELTTLKGDETNITTYRYKLDGDKLMIDMSGNEVHLTRSK